MSEHIKGSMNVQVDRLSRQTIQEVESSLKKYLFVLIKFHFGLPLVGLFTSPNSHKVNWDFTRFYYSMVEIHGALMSQ